MARRTGSDWWMKFEVNAWRGSPRIRMIDAAARGVWLEMLLVMHDTSDFQIKGTAAEMARVLGLSEGEIIAAIAQFQRHDVADVEKDGDEWTVVSRKRQKEEGAREAERNRKRRERAESPKKPEPEQGPKQVAQSVAKPVPVSRKSKAFTKPPSEDYDGKDPVEAYTYYTRTKPPMAHAEQIKHRVKNIPMWCATIEMWMENDYRVRNVMSMIEKYEEDVKPKAQKMIDDGAPPWKVEAARNQANRKPKKCRICGATTPDVGGIKGDYRCNKIKCQAAPPPEGK